VVQTDRGAVAIAQLPPSLTAQLNATSQARGVTLFVSLLTAFQSLLRRYTGQADIAVGTPIANRNRTEDEDLIGFFVNTLVLRTDFSGNPTFQQVLARAREGVVGALSNQDLPFEQLVEELRPERNLAQNPLFQVLFVFQNTPVEDFSASGLRSLEFALDVSATRFDLELYIAELPAGLRLTMCYNPDLFDAATIQRLLGHFRSLLEVVVAHPDESVESTPLLSPAERHQILKVWNDTRVDYPDACLHELFEHQAARTPESIALVFEGTSMTYDELNRRANQLAHHLRTRGVSPEVLVGICMDRSLEMVVGLLGILKAGGAYVPLDPSHPPERIAFMLDDSEPAAVVTSEALLDRLALHRDLAVCLDRDVAQLAACDDGNPVSGATADTLAYAIYTSGSTGMPKGAMNAHRGVVNKLRWMQDEYVIARHDRVMQKTPYTFDVSVWEFFWPLINGACLVIARPGGHQDRTYIADLIEAEQVTIVHFVPSMLHAFLEEPGLERCACVKRVFCSGEALTIELQKRFFSTMTAQLHDLYGPTETAIEVTYWNCRPDTKLASVPIGRPVANTQAYILDETFAPVPIGVTGELFIGGIQVGRGYLRRPALTAEKFVPDPFSATPGARLYRTGDLTRFLQDGTIEYLGRADHQIKIRGFRIELGEIEAALAQHPGVLEAAATVFEQSAADKRLVGYIVPKDGSAPSVPDVRSFLKQKLPAYMVPSTIVVLDRLPQTSSGKVDRRALPAPDSRRDVNAGYVPPIGPVETALADAWKELLRIDRVGAHDNFFELGGHSLLATRVISAARDLFEVDIPLRSFFEGPTVAELGVSVTKRLAGAYDDDALAQMLAEVRQLSEDELQSAIGAPGPIST
jgi:amino acid adenylation domain-containing protein